MLQLAKRAIEYFLQTRLILKIDETELSSFLKLKEKMACFVTLRLGGELRGCIGHLVAFQSLYLDIIGNTISAAFDDPRFKPMIEKEISSVEIEISVLSKPELLVFSSKDQLLKKIKPKVHGVILRKGNYSATYLPQVWQDLPDESTFLSSLCEKAGLDSRAWQRNGIEILTYTSESVK